MEIRMNEEKEPMIVDAHHHMYSKALAILLTASGVWDANQENLFTIRWRGISTAGEKEMTDVRAHMKVCEKAGLTHMMLYQTMAITLLSKLTEMSTIEAAKFHNDTTAKLAKECERDSHIKVFPMGAVKPHDGKEAVKEAGRCIEKLGFKALALETSFGSTDRQYNHTEDTYEFWEYVNHQEIPVFLHPSFLCYGWEFMDRYKLDETVGRPNDTALSISLMILTGLFDRFKQLKIILPHNGGSFMMVLPRLNFGHNLGYQGFLEYQKPSNKRLPEFYVRKHLRVDTMGFDSRCIRHAIEVFGIDNVLLGTDYAAVPKSPKLHIEIIRQMGLDKEDERKILGLNANRLFGLTRPVQESIKERIKGKVKDEFFTNSR